MCVCAREHVRVSQVDINVKVSRTILYLLVIHDSLASASYGSLVQNTLDTAGRAKPKHETDIPVACAWEL